MVGRDDGGLDRLRRAYEQLNSGEKEEILRLAEGLLDRQKATSGEKADSPPKTAKAEIAASASPAGDF
ncbi:MAG: hypothetical protein FWE09_02990 [Treponema sp.]|nr:hypothetical protein [Treponema sp.]